MESMRKGRHQLLQEWLGFVIDLLEVLLSWPVAVTFLVVLFRRQIQQVIPTLGERLKSVSMVGNTIEFESAQQGYSPELRVLSSSRIPRGIRLTGELGWPDETIDEIRVDSYQSDEEEVPAPSDADDRDQDDIDESEIQEFQRVFRGIAEQEGEEH